MIQRILFALLLCFSILLVHGQDNAHWMVLVNGQRAFECPSTCAAHGVDLKMLKSPVSIKAGDKVTIIYLKDSVEPRITKIITLSDTAQSTFQPFSVYDEDGTHAITLKVDDFNLKQQVLLWYSEKKVVGNREVFTTRVPLVYFP